MDVELLKHRTMEGFDIIFTLICLAFCWVLLDWLSGEETYAYIGSGNVHCASLLFPMILNDSLLVSVLYGAEKKGTESHL